MQEWAIRILALAVFFLAGYADLVILKSRGTACMMWFIGVMIASFCVGYLPLPAPIGIIAGCIIVEGPGSNPQSSRRREPFLNSSAINAVSVSGLWRRLSSVRTPD
jgi:hypothetical protein